MKAVGEKTPKLPPLRLAHAKNIHALLGSSILQITAKFHLRTALIEKGSLKQEPFSMGEINMYCGYDEREAVGWHVFAHSVITRASKPVHITPLASMGLPQGSNTFTLSRFLVPYLCGFRGHAIFADACDMLMLADVRELDALFDPHYAVQVVHHPEYRSQHARKYIGTEMECDQSNYERKNWASVAIFRCDHPAWRVFSPSVIASTPPLQLLQFQMLREEESGSLPSEWNVLIDEGQEREGAKLLHWTNGLPSFRHYRNARGSKEWFAEFESMSQAMQEA